VTLLSSLLATALGLRQGVPQGIPADVGPQQTTASGLNYSVLKPGQPGDAPKFGDKVTCHYTGWNLDGSVFDSSRNDPKPSEFVIGDVIEGWNEALQLMTPGAHWKLVIPPELGYGERGSGRNIKPNATLVFEIEMLSFAAGPKLPPFHPGDPAKQVKSESGLLIETLVEGNGTKPGADEMLELRYAVWTPKGRLLDCTEKSGNVLKAKAAELPLRFLQVVPQHLTIGARVRVEVPAELAGKLPWFGTPFLPAGSVTVWEVELVGVVTPPKFTPPDPTKQTTTKSGLKYEVLKEGAGRQAAVGDNVTVCYSGWLPDGTMFDSSKLRGDGTAQFPLRPGGLIAGWIEGVALMKEGALYRFEIPGNLAYGPTGRPPKIPANATLIFEIELVKSGK
jgi:FKBP-type peptidyl-prolyl cis-trans isomerase